jgi:hypothetical protein
MELQSAAMTAATREMKLAIGTVEPLVDLSAENLDIQMAVMMVVMMVEL